MIRRLFLTARSGAAAAPGNPVATLWQRRPRMLGGAALTLALFAIAVNPQVHNLSGLVLHSRPVPKSGYWVSSILAALCALALVLARRHRWAARFLMGLLSLTTALVLCDTVLRLWPPVEVTGASTPPRERAVNSWGFCSPEPRLSAEHRILVLGDSITWGMGEGLTTTNRYQDLLARNLGKPAWMSMCKPPRWRDGASGITSSSIGSRRRATGRRSWSSAGA